jgi:hypothetical protein
VNLVPASRLQRSPRPSTAALAVVVAALAAAGACRRATPAAATQPAHGPSPAVHATAPARPAPEFPPPPRGKEITIVYSSNLLGEYEPCG